VEAHFPPGAYSKLLVAGGKLRNVTELIVSPYSSQVLVSPR
jgi:hypothetical protein